jgi:flagellar M-ring protein FliF
LPSAAELWTSVTRFWQGLHPRRRRGVLTAGAVALIALGIWGAIQARGPAMAPLFTQLQPTDAASIVSQLQSQHVPYQLADNGATIMVPQSQVYQLRLDMAAKGLPSEGVVGFSLFDNTSITQTQFDQQVNFLRALEGELTKTILYINGVQAARVALTLPNQSSSFLSSNNPPPTASVLLQMAPGAQLATSQVQGIMHLVAASVQGMKPSDVTVLDSHGDLLSAQVSADQNPTTGTLAQQQIDLTNQFDQQLQSSLETLLEQVLGVGNVVTRVQATLNFDQQTTTSQLFQPVQGTQQGVLQSVNDLKETFTGTGTPPAPAGSASNTPSYPFTASGSGNNQYSQTQNQSQYAVSQITQHTTVAPGAVQRLSVAVAVNQSLTTAQQQAITQMVNAAIGADPTRKDQITVVGMPFAVATASGLVTAPKGAATPSPVLPLALAAVAAVSVITALVLTVRGGSDTEDLVAVAAERRLAEQLVGRSSIPAGGGVPADGAAEDIDLLDDSNDPDAVRRAARQETEQRRREIVSVVQRRPEDVANVLRSWLTEEQG